MALTPPSIHSRRLVTGLGVVAPRRSMYRGSTHPSGFQALSPPQKYWESNSQACAAPFSGPPNSHFYGHHDPRLWPCLASLSIGLLRTWSVPQTEPYVPPAAGPGGVGTAGRRNAELVSRT